MKILRMVLVCILSNLFSFLKVDVVDGDDSDGGDGVDTWLGDGVGVRTYSGDAVDTWLGDGVGVRTHCGDGVDT